MILEITNLSLNLIEADVRRLFYPFGEVGTVQVLRYGYNHRSSGKAQVEMPIDKEARQAMTTLQGRIFAGKPIRITSTPSPSEGAPLGSSI
jgi:RNA recognition motif-containing protein